MRRSARWTGSAIAVVGAVAIAALAILYLPTEQRVAERQWKVEKGAVEAGKATFEVQQPDGPLFKFTLTVVKGRLQGDMAGEREGVVRGHAKVDAAKAK